jgi:hypothetical protein
LVARVEHKGEMSREFTYAAGGQVQCERRGCGAEIAYQVKQTGRCIRIADAARDGIETAFLDLAMRPARRVLPDGMQMDWTYAESGAVNMGATTPDGDRLTIARTADQGQRNPRGPRYGHGGVPGRQTNGFPADRRRRASSSVLAAR